MRSGGAYLTKLFIFLFLTMMVANISSLAGEYTVSSPDGSIEATINESPNFRFMVTKDGQTAIEWSPLGVELNTVDFRSGVEFVSQETNEIDDSYNPVHGPKSLYIDRCSELTLNLQKGSNQFALVFRAYDEGIALRYVLKGSGSATARSEATSFVFPTGTVRWLGQGTGDYQCIWAYASGTQNGSFQIPVLGRTPDDIYVLISESAVYGTFCNSHFSASGLTYRINYSGQPTNTLPLEMPWRLALVGSLANIVENTQQMVEVLNDPNELGDVSWVKPGRVSWSWLTQGVRDLNQQKRYVDFSKEMGWEYTLVDAGWRSTNMPQLAPYAQSQGIGLILWYDYDEMNTVAEMSSILDDCTGWGIKGIKVDYVFSDDQNHMKWYEDITKAAAEAHLMIYFHGCTTPRGQMRKWPNYMTTEAIYGAEQDMFQPKVPVVHKCIIPYTRNAVAAMDYTPSLFSKVTYSTKASELAQSVVYYSSLQHLCDNPEGYQAVTPSIIPFLKDVVSSWDDVKFLDGEPGNYCCLARRKGDDWFLAGINNAARTVELDLSFLKPGTYEVDLYTDRQAGSREMDLEQVTLTSPGTLTVNMIATGGFACKVPNSSNPTAVREQKKQMAVTKKNRDFTIVRVGDNYTTTTQGTDTYNFTLFNCYGQTIAHIRKSGEGIYRIPASSLTPGAYIVQAAAKNSVRVKRFVHR